jgi:hypothetical protein
MQPIKPGWKTSELYLSIAPMLVYGLLALNIVPHSGTISIAISAGAAALSAFGYAWARAWVKTPPPK